MREFLYEIFFFCFIFCLLTQFTLNILRRASEVSEVRKVWRILSGIKSLILKSGGFKLKRNSCVKVLSVSPGSVLPL